MVTSSSAESSTLVFFVPGIMGSSLFLTRKTALGGNRERIEIWGKNFEFNVSLFHKNAAYLNPLNPDDIEGGEVIPYFENIRLPHEGLRFLPIPVNKVIVYQSLMDFCTQENGLRLTQESFFPFAYNWLADNRVTAKKLATYIKEKDINGNSRFRFIAHSMGGIIIRLMLLKNPDIAERTDLLFEIASPIKGSAKAYHSIKCYPTLHPLFDRAWQLFQKGANMGDLQKALERCYSLYQLLPPPEIITLYDEGGTGYSALDHKIWHEDLHKYVNAAIEVHQQLAKSQNLNVKIKCVFSAQHPTLTHYIVDPDNFKIKRPVPSFIMGDGTVTVASAISYSRENPIVIETPPGDHMEICQNQKVYNLLREEW